MSLLQDRPLREAADNAEMKLVMSCPHCAPELRRRWADAAYKALAKRYEMSGLHSLVLAWTKRTAS